MRVNLGLSTHIVHICPTRGLMQLKVVHRVHSTNASLARIYPNVEPFCPRCRGQLADLIHMFWLCPKLSSFWRDVWNTIGLIPVETHVLLLNKANVVVAFSTLLARQLILLKWKQQTPFFTKWIKVVLYFLKLEKIMYTLKGSSQTFIKT